MDTDRIAQVQAQIEQTTGLINHCRRAIESAATDPHYAPFVDVENTRLEEAQRDLEALKAELAQLNADHGTVPQSAELEKP